MQNSGKIIIGIIIFLAILSIPVIVTQVSGNANYVPDPQPPDEEVVEAFSGSTDYECMESTEYMRVNHMKLLLDYREWAVRDDNRSDPGDIYYIDANGNKKVFSLNGTCLGCHTDREVFCDVCHDYTATQLGCWDCHD